MSDTATTSEAPAAAPTGKPKRWYIVHAYSNFENKVAESIRDQAKQRGLAEHIDEVLVPKEKVTWPTRRETLITTGMVFVMVALASVFFFGADLLIRALVTFVLGIGR